MQHGASLYQRPAITSLRSVYTTEPSSKCNKFVSANRADCQTIRGDPFLVSISAKHKGIWGYIWTTISTDLSIRRIGWNLCSLDNHYCLAKHFKFEDLPECSYPFHSCWMYNNFSLGSNVCGKYLEPLPPLLGEKKTCTHRVFCKKFHIIQSLFKVFFNTVDTFGGIPPQSEPTFPFKYIIIFI